MAGVEASISDENVVVIKNANIVVESQDDDKMQVSSMSYTTNFLCHFHGLYIRCATSLIRKDKVLFFFFCLNLLFRHLVRIFGGR